MDKINIEKKQEKIEKALDILSSFEYECRLCPRECGVNRQKTKKGFCKSGNQAKLSHSLRHFGEEPVLSGHFDCSKNQRGRSKALSGSGTIFFSGCNLKCLFCQNFQLSWLNQGHQVTDRGLAQMMLKLQADGALNINLVSPTHMILPILRALKIAYSDGLEIPIVYNSNGYEKTEVLRNLKGIVDIYLPDLKYFSPQVASSLSGTPGYFQCASKALKEMYRQQPELILTKEEIALSGLIIRHLALPGQTKDSLAILNWIAQELSPSVCLGLMSQYYPCFKAPQEIQRTLTPEEYRTLVLKAEELGFENIFLQTESFEKNEHLLPDFNTQNPFQWDSN